MKLQQWLQQATLVFLIQVVNQSKALKCYVCGVASNSVGPPHYPPRPVPPCKELDEYQEKHQKHRIGSDISDIKETSLAKFIVECPEEYVGCITQSHGQNVTRNCDTVAFNDCLTANNVTYCYCNYDLCNGHHLGSDQQPEGIVGDQMLLDDNRMVEMSHESHLSNIPFLETTDDEDYAQQTDIMSGFGKNYIEDDEYENAADKIQTFKGKENTISRQQGNIDNIANKDRNYKEENYAKDDEDDDDGEDDDDDEILWEASFHGTSVSSSTANHKSVGVNSKTSSSSSMTADNVDTTNGKKDEVTQQNFNVAQTSETYPSSNDKDFRIISSRASSFQSVAENRPYYSRALRIFLFGYFLYSVMS